MKQGATRSRSALFMSRARNSWTSERITLVIRLPDNRVMKTQEHKPNILLVEDSEDDAYFFERALRKTGVDCDYVWISEGQEAVKYLKQFKGKGRLMPETTRPDIIFLDLKLVAFSGFEVLQELNQERFDPAFHVVILSGSDHETDKRRARELGARDYVVKPIHPNDLKRRLEALTSHKGQLAGVDAHYGVHE